MNDARELTKRLAELLRREQGAMADFLLALADFDERKAWRDLGHTSLFYFLHRELGLSKGAAHFRKTAAELVQRFPEVIEPLRDGRLCISSVVELAKVITPENRAEVLPRFFHRSKQEAKVVSAELCPDTAPPRRDVVTSVRTPALALSLPARAPVRTPGEPVDRAQSVHPDEPFDRAQSVRPDEPARPTSPAQRDSVEPLTAELSRLHATVSRRFLAKLDAARDALSHSRPNATMEELLEAGLDLVLAAHARRKGLVAKPRSVPPPSNPDSDQVPAHVKREVWTRDGGRCQFRLEDGSICGSTFQVEFDHIRPRALGGPSTAPNLRLACRPHNGLAARRIFGDVRMDLFQGGKQTRGGPDGRPSAGQARTS